MKDTCKAGLTRSMRIVADSSRAIRHLGPDCGVYATPALVNDIETLCRDLLLEHAENGEDSVGTEVAIRHLAPTPEGHWAEITATVKTVDGRSVTFAITGRDAADEIVSGTHTRAVVSRDRIRRRIEAKAAGGG